MTHRARARPPIRPASQHDCLVDRLDERVLDSLLGSLLGVNLANGIRNLVEDGVGGVPRSVFNGVLGIQYLYIDLYSHEFISNKVLLRLLFWLVFTLSAPFVPAALAFRTSYFRSSLC